MLTHYKKKNVSQCLGGSDVHFSNSGFKRSLVQGFSPDFKPFSHYFVFYMSPPLYFMSLHPKIEVNIFYKLSFLFNCTSVLIKSNINKTLFILWPLLVIYKPVLLFWTNIKK